MENAKPRPPVIIIGMHRSGTALITRSLEKLGLFPGWRLEENHESIFFLKYNRWMLFAAGGRWDTPENINHLLNDADGIKRAVEVIRRRASSLSAIEHLGPGRWMRYRSIMNITEPWGWKDPRNTLTLPVWLELFPEAKVIHVVRNGVDVADSLRRRHGKLFENKKPGGLIRLLSFSTNYMYDVFGGSPRVRNLDGGFSLWEEYLDFAQRNLAGLGERAFTLRYEDFLANPAEHVPRLASFCGLDASGEKISTITSVLKPDRAKLFASDSELKTFWDSVKDTKWMAEFGYGNIEMEKMNG